jgi:hypothetical protein
MLRVIRRRKRAAAKSEAPQAAAESAPEAAADPVAEGEAAPGPTPTSSAAAAAPPAVSYPSSTGSVDVLPTQASRR